MSASPHHRENEKDKFEEDEKAHHDHVMVATKEVDSGAALSYQGEIDPAEATRIRCAIFYLPLGSLVELFHKTEDRQTHSSFDVQYVYFLLFQFVDDV